MPILPPAPRGGRSPRRRAGGLVDMEASPPVRRLVGVSPWLSPGSDAFTGRPLLARLPEGAAVTKWEDAAATIEAMPEG